METTRRTFLCGLAAASVPAGARAATVLNAGNSGHVAQENPDLLAAYADFIAAQEEIAAANDDLQWLADEWKHLWPLAPEELLGCANAERRSTYIASAVIESDILGRPLMRDTAALTKRFTPAQRRSLPTTCFTLWTEDSAKKRLAEWEAYTPKGRTPKALANSQAKKAKFISDLTRRVDLAREYEAETARVRLTSGVDALHDRVAMAGTRCRAACSAISRAPAHTGEGLRMKAEALLFAGQGLFDAECLQGGLMGDIARFIKATVSVTGVPSA